MYAGGSGANEAGKGEPTVPGFALDTSCMVATVCSWHQHHERAAAEVNRRLSARQRMLIAAPALVETYAVLTRLPAPHRLSEADALQLIDSNFIQPGRVVALNAAAYARLLRRAPDDGVAGGRVYDAVIAQCAVQARASALLTFNERHFASLPLADLEIVVP